ncbi:MAG: beta-ketoacyl-[acyl-carrier-protein] synthase family protein [Endomicrobium sp.]|jgi:3-oxoacyl-[acyl-carrier-protein] synthase II|nr:beta-ketoacyl-[acyl-carrier-protein] synthase family protein [Endomicrobium sp.]
MKLGITGIGIVSPLGIGKETNWKRLINSESAVKYNKILDIYSACVNDFGMQESKRQYEMAKTAVLEAVLDADLNNSSFDRKRIGLCLGESKINLFKNDFSLGNSLANKLKETFCFYGESITLSAACATGILTIIKGCQLIKNRLCDAVVCGCSETSIHPLYAAGFKNMGVLTKHNPSPFDKNRDGFAIGEGSCFVVIENIEKSLKGNAKVYCEVAGYSNGIYSDDILATKSRSKIKDIIKKAVNVKNETPDYIHMHGTGTKLNDYNESLAVSEVFENAKEISLSSTKAATGHMLGVSGIIGTAFSILSMENNVVPPTLNFKATDINLDLDYTPNNAKNKIINSSLALSFGFGGQGSALLLEKFIPL